MAAPSQQLNIAAALQEIGLLLELKGGRYFQARAYKRAAQILTEIKDTAPTSVVTSKAAIRGHFKTGQRSSRLGR